MMEKPNPPKAVWYDSETEDKVKDPMMVRYAIQYIINRVWERIPIIPTLIISKWLRKSQIRIISDKNEDPGSCDWKSREIKLNISGKRLTQKEEAQLIFSCAHEFGHAYWFAISKYLIKSQKTEKVERSLFLLLSSKDFLDFDNIANQESMANALAISWGFLPELAKGKINASHFEYAEKRRLEVPESFNLTVDVIKAAKILKRRFKYL